MMNDQYFDADNSVDIQVGTSFKDAWIFADVHSASKLVESRIVKCDNSNENITFKYLPEYGDGIVVNFVVVKNGKSYDAKVRIRVPKPDRKLNLKWHTFRDRLVPGQKETWKLSVSKPDGTPAEAQVVATMYDGALDMLRPHSLYFEYSNDWNLPYSLWHYYKGDYTMWIIRDFKIKGSCYVKEYGYDIPMWRCPFSNPVVSDVLCVVDNSSDEVEYESIPVKANSALKMKTRMAYSAEGVTEDVTNNASSTIAPRTNLSETAFFYPALQTDKDGIAIFMLTERNDGKYESYKAQIEYYLRLQAEQERQMKLKGYLDELAKVYKVQYLDKKYTPPQAIGASK